MLNYVYICMSQILKIENMKRILILSLLTLASILGMSAQGSKSAVLKMGYQSDYERFGIGLEGRYEFLHNIRLAPEVTFFIPNHKTIGLDINFNAQYTVKNVVDNLILYPFAGLNMSNNHYSGQKFEMGGVEYNTSSSYTNFGFNLGAGAEYRLDYGFLVFDIKVVFADKTYGQFNIGYGFNF